MRKFAIATSITIGIVCGTASIAAAQMHSMPPTAAEEFHRIEQPLNHKIAVTLAGIGLIGLELWWFLLSKPKSRQATAKHDRS